MSVARNAGCVAFVPSAAHIGKLRRWSYVLDWQGDVSRIDRIIRRGFTWDRRAYILFETVGGVMFGYEADRLVRHRQLISLLSRREQERVEKALLNEPGNRLAGRRLKILNSPPLNELPGVLAKLASTADQV
jgi:hypothetical protein